MVNQLVISYHKQLLTIKSYLLLKRLVIDITLINTLVIIVSVRDLIRPHQKKKRNYSIGKKKFAEAGTFTA